jgi:hypothetical protein
MWKIGRRALLLLTLCACGTARYIQKTPTGGTLELEGDPDRASLEAKRLMIEHCKGSFQVTSEGERFVGTEAERRQQTKTVYVCTAPPEKKKPQAAAPAPPAEAPDAGASQ